MSVLLNLIWIFLAGLWLFLCYLLIGLSFCATIIGIPMGLVSMMIGVQMLMPFGKNVVPRPGGSPGFIGLLLACFWILTAGPVLCVLHLVAGLAMCLTVIGIPIGLQNFKFMQVALLPMHYELR